MYWVVSSLMKKKVYFLFVLLHFFIPLWYKGSVATVKLKKQKKGGSIWYRSCCVEGAMTTIRIHHKSLPWISFLFHFRFCFGERSPASQAKSAFTFFQNENSFSNSFVQLPNSFVEIQTSHRNQLHHSHTSKCQLDNR